MSSATLWVRSYDSLNDTGDGGGATSATDMELIRDDLIRLRGRSFGMKCQRCVKDEAAYRVFTDLIDMKVCAACAEEARKIGIAVEDLGCSGAKKERA